MELGRALLHDRFFQAAVSQIELRAEHQQELAHLADTFVDPGVAVQLQNDNSQILYGRRGTGKTHLLKVIQSHLQALDESARLAIYLDMRKLGSSSIFEDTRRPMSVRVAGLLRDVLEMIHAALLARATDPGVEVTAAALDDLELFERVIINTVSKGGIAHLHDSGPGDDATEATGGLNGIPRDPEAPDGQGGRTAQGGDSPARTIFFSQIAQTVSDVLDSCGIAHLTILFDEWNHIPIDLQPMLAEFLRKGLMCLPQVAVKIATLEYRTNFREARDAHNNVIGFELGADVATALELDEYYVYYGQRSKVPDHFAELLFRHISREVDRQSGRPGYLAQTYEISDRGQLVGALFASRRTFLELVRAGEGVARDFINVFSKAYFRSVRDDEPGVRARAIRDAAAEWYELDKALNLRDREEQALEIISQQVITRNGTVNFLLSRREERCALVRALVDLRLIHLLKRGYRPDRRNPATRYNIYALDYGTYAHLLGGSEPPQLLTIEMMRAGKQPLVLLDALVRRLDSAVGPLSELADSELVAVRATV